MAYCNHAHNGKAGGIVWLSWRPDGRADENNKFQQWMLTPCHGATLLGVTVRGAVAMAQAMQQSTPKHFDFWLKGSADEQDRQAVSEQQPIIRRIFFVAPDRLVRHPQVG